MSKFTPGEWKAFYGEKFHVIRQTQADDVEGHDYGNGQIIAHVVQWHEGHDWANARLIAAAPEMYELLKIWTEIGVQPTRKEARERARELLDRIDDDADAISQPATPPPATLRGREQVPV